MTLINNHLGFSKLVSFQKGGPVSQTNEKMERLLPYLAYKLTTQDDPTFAELYKQVKIDPTKYKGQSMQDWTVAIQTNKEDLDQITKLAAKLPEEFWNQLDQQYAQEQQTSQEQETQFARKGAKLKKLKEKIQPQKSTKKGPEDIPQEKFLKKESKPSPMLEKGGPIKKKRKCGCGCDLILTKEKGGKLTETCSCNCKGGKMKKK